MKSNLLLIWFIQAFLLDSLHVFAQTMDLSMNQVTFQDMTMKLYPKDTSANAVVLNELGQAHISDISSQGLIFERYMKIKILKRGGFDHGTFAIRLQKNDNNTSESFASVKASTYNMVNGSMKETKMDPKSFFISDDYKYSSLATFTLPDIREGSVIEVLYQINSPFTFNFREWEF